MHATVFGKASAVLRIAIRALLTVAVLGSFGLSLQAWVAAPHVWQPAGLAAATAIGPLAVIVLIIGIPAGLRLVASPKRALRDALLILAIAGTFLGIAAGKPGLTAFAFGALLALMLARGLWPQLSDAHVRVQGWSLLIGASIAIVALFLLDRPWGLLLAAFALVLVAALLATAWGILLLMRNAPLPLDSARGPVTAVYETHAVAGVSPYVLMRDKRWFWSRDRKAFLAYGARAGVAVVLGPGIGPESSVQALYREFREACHLRGWKLGFYQVPAGFTNVLGWGTQYPLGSEAIVDITRLTLNGSAMAKLRHEVSRGRRNGVAVRIVSASELTPDVRDAMGALAARWASRHALGEMSFSVSHRADAPLAPTIFGLAYDSAGQLVAYTSWLALPGSRGMVLDEIRRTPETPAGAMDLLLYTCMEQFKHRATWASLGLAPVASASASRLTQLAGNVLPRLGVSVSSSLFSFKDKFQPRWEPRYMVAEHLWEWPALATATFVVHYPAVDARVRRFAPALAGRVPARFAAGLTAALVAVGMSGILAAAGQSKQGHPLYSAHLAASEVAAVLPFTGRPAAPPAIVSVEQPHHAHADTAYHPVRSVTSRRSSLPRRADSDSVIIRRVPTTVIFVEAKPVLYERKQDPVTKHVIAARLSHKP